MSYHTILYRIWYIVSYTVAYGIIYYIIYIVSYIILYGITHRIIPHNAMSHGITCHVAWSVVNHISYHTISHHTILSYHIISHIISYRWLRHKPWHLQHIVLEKTQPTTKPATSYDIHHASVLFHKKRESHRWLCGKEYHIIYHIICHIISYHISHYIISYHIIPHYII